MKFFHSKMPHVESKHCFPKIAIVAIVLVVVVEDGDDDGGDDDDDGRIVSDPAVQLIPFIIRMSSDRKRRRQVFEDLI